ncbi:23485_t:CDS:2 [Gigaspora rosea]|nr:23485_t:CDS:2 [Gigaspora rosea]
MDGYLEDEYDALKASLENIMNMVNHDHILEIWKVLLFDHRDYSYLHYVILLIDSTHLCTCLYIISTGSIAAIFSHWYTDQMQVSGYSVITSSDAIEFDMNKEMNQVVSIRGSNMYQASIYASVTEKQKYAHGFGIAKSGLKFAMENRLVNKFVGLIVKFIENYSEVNTNEQMTVNINQIENLKKAKHKRCPRLQNSEQQSIFEDINAKQDLNKRQDLDDLNSN